MAEVYTKVSEKPNKNLSTKLKEWGIKQAQGNQKLGLQETGLGVVVPTAKTPEPAKVIAPKIERTTAGETKSKDETTLRTKIDGMPPYSPKKLTKNPERFLQ